MPTREAPSTPTCSLDEPGKLGVPLAALGDDLVEEVPLPRGPAARRRHLRF
jgi:hypothetical protein